MKAKFSIGQRVKIQRYNPWVGDYEVAATIIGFDNVFINGVPTYKIKTTNEEFLTEISETELMTYS
jgi:hypothetical protein